MIQAIVIHRESYPQSMHRVIHSLSTGKLSTVRAFARESYPHSIHSESTGN
jgi:hypothetical protein